MSRKMDCGGQEQLKVWYKHCRCVQSSDCHCPVRGVNFNMYITHLTLLLVPERRTTLVIRDIFGIY